MFLEFLSLFSLVLCVLILVGAIVVFKALDSRFEVLLDRLLEAEAKLLTQSSSAKSNQRSNKEEV